MQAMNDDDTPSFAQVFYEDKAIAFVLNSLRDATSLWAASSLFNETVLLNEVAEALSKIGKEKCPSQNYPEIQVSTERAILDKAAGDNSDMFDADLGLSLSMYENDELIKQRTALFQLKLGERAGTETKYKLDVRQVYNSGHNKHAADRWFMAVCETSHGVWSFGTARQIGSRLQEDQLSKVQYATSEDRVVVLRVADDWWSISQWIGDWLAGAIGRDSDLSDPNRIEMLIEKVRQREAAKKKGQDIGYEFERQFAAEGAFLPRVYLDVRVKSVKARPRQD